jgi:hypothetical protein
VTVYPPDWEGQHRVSDPAAPSPEEGLFARIEGLVGEEAAMLRIPAEERSHRQRGRLRSLADELDRAFESLRDRARRLADGRNDMAAG